MEAHRRPKEAHVVAAMTAAMAAHGLGEVQPLELTELEDTGVKGATGRPIVKLVKVDNVKAHRTSVHERAAFARAYVDGAVKGHRPPARGARAGEAHVAHGDSIAHGKRIEAQLEALKLRKADEREQRVLALAHQLEADPSCAIKLAREADKAELADALALLGVKEDEDGEVPS